MTWGEVGALISVLMAAGAGVAALIAYGRANRMAESQVISVTVEAAESVVSLVTAQLERTVQEHALLVGRVEALEKALNVEQSRATSLSMQLGKVRKRVLVLEQYIADLGHPVPGDEDE